MGRPTGTATTVSWSGPFNGAVSLRVRAVLAGYTTVLASKNGAQLVSAAAPAQALAIAFASPEPFDSDVGSANTFCSVVVN